MTYWFAGNFHSDEQITLTATHPALAYGASVFTTIRVYEHNLAHPLTAWQAHCDRIAHTLHTFGWPQPHWSRTTAGAQALLAHYPVLRLAIG